MITPRPADSEYDDEDHDDENPSHSASSIADIQFWIDHPSLDDLTAAQTEPDRQQVRCDVEDCIRLLSLPTNRLGHIADEVELDSTTQHLPQQRYKVLKLLGVGAFGVVLHARDRVLNREVAIKILRPSVMLSKQARTRFAIEGEALARCNCEGIVPIHEVGQIDGKPYLVMGLIPGVTLADYIKSQESPVAAPIAARIVAAIADAIHRAHQRGILHRDLKPSNVLLEKIDDARSGLPFNLFVSDFGLAKDLLPNSNGSHGDSSTESPIIGTVRYMSPEQATGQSQDVSVASDVFSLGVILYELLTLKCPFHAATTFEIIQQVATTPAKPPRQLNSNVSRDLNAIVGHCLSKLPSERYQSASDLSDDLHRYLKGKPVVAKPAGPIKATLFWARRNPSLAIASAIIWCGLLISTITIALLYRENLKNLQAAKEANVQAEASRKFTLKAIDSSFRYTAEKILHNHPQSQILKLQLHQKALQINEEYAELRGHDEESLYRLNIAHHYVANDAFNCQQFELASFHRNRCLEIVDALAQKDPKNGDYQFDLFMNLHLTPQGKMPVQDYLAWQLKARDHLLAAISLLPHKPDFRDADAAICYQLAFIDPSRRDEWLERSVGISLDVGREYPDKPHYFKHAINGLSTLAKNEIDAGEWIQACKHCEEAIGLIEKHFRKSHDIADVHHYTLTTLDYYTQALEHVDKERAIEVYDQYIAESFEIEKLEPRFEFYQMGRAGAYFGQARMHHELDDNVSCETAWAKAVETLVSYKPKHPSFEVDLSKLQSKMADFEKVRKSQK